LFPSKRKERRADVPDPQTWIPYCGVAPNPGEWLVRWNLDPVLLIALGAAALLGRAANNPARFWTAWGTLLLLFVSPLCALSSALFSVRVAHHALLVAAVAPLLAGAFALPRPRGGISAWTAAHIVILWMWHAPPLYAWALASDTAFWLMQLSLLGSAFGFWLAIRRAPELVAVGALLIGMMQMGLLGALITFAGAPLYAPHLLTTMAWDFSPLEDQQLAGLIMWAPAALAYLGSALFLLGRSLSRAEQASA
jgi:putative membrane protein